MAAVVKHVVPWIDKNEFECVYNEIFSDDADLQRHAVGRLSVWNCRVSDDRHLPPFIICTSELLSAALLEKDCDDLHLRLACSMALVRFVNLLTEDLERSENRERAYGLAQRKDGRRSGQHQYTLDDKRTTLREFISMLGIPGWQLDLRHSATHSKHLPAKLQLQRAVQSALEYLQETCWKPQLDSIAASSVGESLDEDLDANIRSFLEAYLEQQIMAVTTVVKRGKKRQPIRTQDVLSLLEPIVRQNSGCFLTILVEDGHLLCTEDSLLSLGVNPHDLMKNADNLELPEIVVRVWQPVLYLVNSLQLTPGLLDLLVSRLTESATLRDRVVAGWIAVILAAAEHSVSDKAPAGDFYYIRPCRVIGRRLLQTVVRSPNRFTAALIKHIFPLCVPSLSQNSQHQLLKLVRCYMSPPAVTVDNDEPVYELSQLEVEDSLPMVTEVNKRSSEKVARWTLASDKLNWSEWPLGSFNGQNATFRSFELPNELDLIECQSFENEDQSDTFQDVRFLSDVEMETDANNTEEVDGGRCQNDGLSTWKDLKACGALRQSFMDSDVGVQSRLDRILMLSASS